MFVLAATVAAGCASTDADESNVGGSEAVAPRTLSQAELDTFSKALNRPAPLYYYQTYHYNWHSREYQLVRGGSLHAYLTPVSPERLEKLADGTFTDGRFNRIEMQPVELEGQAHTFAFTGTPDGTRIYSVADPREMGGVRFAVIERYRELISVIVAAESFDALINALGRFMTRTRGAGGGSSPAIGETPPVLDPRCQGRAVDAARGTLFTNRAFCGGDDPLTCLRREQDSLYDLTDGQCWTETGPDDSHRVVCKRNEREDPDRPEVDGQVEVPGCKEQDADCFTDPVAPRNPRGQVMLRYVDVTPLGAFLLGWCARGGCPDPATLR